MQRRRQQRLELRCLRLAWQVRELPICIRKLPICVRKLPICIRELPICVGKLPICVCGLPTFVRSRRCRQQRLTQPALRRGLGVAHRLGAVIRSPTRPPVHATRRWQQHHGRHAGAQQQPPDDHARHSALGGRAAHGRVVKAGRPFESAVGQLDRVDAALRVARVAAAAAQQLGCAAGAGPAPDDNTVHAATPPTSQRKRLVQPAHAAGPSVLSVDAVALPMLCGTVSLGSLGCVGVAPLAAAVQQHNAREVVRHW
mmetsp:Transcript_30144/g.89439  ORF Transcript_30144/g.89439 Transcript_30144/m.89439 type:complete len:256 (-) Transcript_30144:194-961(-)